MSVRHQWLQYFCDVLGWLYFAAWSVSFYPQLLLNFKRKTTYGLSYDYQSYNFTGFLFYSIYCVCTYVNYDNTHSSNSNNPIELNDIAFAVHAFVITCVILVQIMIYPRHNQHVSKFAIVFLFLAWVFAFYNLFLSILYQLSSGDDKYGLPWFGGYSTVSYLGFVKVSISIIKYVPQAYMNWRDKSTTGWSIGNVVLDFTGLFFSHTYKYFIPLYTYTCLCVHIYKKHHLFICAFAGAH
ncbi:hypothetical protein RFI_20288 [Reticulomyxa filosa]|uniref:Cystinosin n=1 Tax=Reticulomyxa filosa TaxID=46433 RepID=X6MVB2_RETFI|nr:hypothetical protein RFI_20288 [Reticulomyxa filosa]|eukprot:ETO17045.1 hypothetical protein RFI_20288 [Reticulomyxa filosa]